MLDKTFDPQSAEPRLYAAWERSGAFSPDHALARNPAAKPFCMVIPPHNVTGSLHVGHALNGTLQDVLARFHRMRGEAVLWLPGTDHAGIATQMIVERRLAAEGNMGRRELGRDAFVERIWAWKAESGGSIVNQLRRLGASCDWSRERFTLDEGLSAAVRRVFVSLYNDGLIYRDKRLVNWDPVLLSAVSDLDPASLARALDHAVGSAFVTAKVSRRSAGSSTLRIENRLPFTVANLTVKAGASSGAPLVTLSGVGVGPGRNGMATIPAAAGSVDRVELNGL